jgi:hypothetical protein
MTIPSAPGIAAAKERCPGHEMTKATGTAFA